jgi:hypothetical protein
MHLKFAHSILAGLAALMLLTACKDKAGPQQPLNVFPKAHAGQPQTVVSGATVTLNGTASSDADGTIVGYAWTQTEGPTVALSDPSSAQPTFVAPQVTVAVTLRFSLVVTDNRGAKSSPTTVAVTVSSFSAGVVTIAGTVRFERALFNNTSPFGLNYAAPVLQPAREVEVRVLESSSLALLATGVTDATGAYSFTVPGNANVVLQVVARTIRAGQGAPRWNVRVQNDLGPDTQISPYSYNSQAFNSDGGGQDVIIPMGIPANGTPVPLQQRASGPFAILDTIYKGLTTVLSVAPDTYFPPLYVTWGNHSSGTFFSPSGQYIGLLSNLTEDTDEFDEHVVAHEFGHYLENNFSRSDSIGGQHGLGDQLDMRVAFGEGFGYAFAAIVLGSANSRDSFVSGGTHASSGFNIELNPPAGLSGPGCWCSEPSVWSILWDIYDAAPDGADDIELGFAPIWQVMTGAQRTTPAMTSIFSFAAALKELRPDAAAGIDALLAAQNIDGDGINAFATTQTSAPDPRLLPLYPEITRGGPPVTVASIGQRTPSMRLYNKVGNRAFLRFVPTESVPVNITVVTSNANTGAQAGDPDFRVFRNGSLVTLENDPPEYPPGTPPRTETGVLNVTAGQTYIIEAYDCANGCVEDPPQGIAGDYTLTVTIN